MATTNNTSGFKSAPDFQAFPTDQTSQQQNYLNNVKKIIIEGTTHAGRKFRPSDWAERMSGALSTFGRDHRIRYSPMLQPLTIKGVKCIALDPKMQEHFPEMYSYIMGWANNNDLVISEGEIDPETKTLRETA